MRHDLTTLQIFLCVAEEKSLTRASKRAHLAVSAISKRIAELEGRIGAQLFIRLARGMELTPAGQSMLTYARRVFDTLQQLDNEMDGYSEGIKGNIKIHASTSALTQFLPSDIQTFAEQYPGIKFDIEERVGPAIVSAVSDGLADIGIFAANTPAEGLETLAYRSDELTLAVYTDHPLYTREAAKFSEAIKYEFVGSHVNSALYALLSAEADKIETQLNFRIRVSSFDCMCHLVAGQQGIAILPRYVINIYAKTLPIKAVKLDESWARRQLLIGFKSYPLLTPTVKSFVDHIRS